jgi:hypothetical protein
MVRRVANGVLEVAVVDGVDLFTHNLLNDLPMDGCPVTVVGILYLSHYGFGKQGLQV